MADSDIEIEVAIPEHVFEKLRTDWQFARMLQFGRYVNQLSYALATVPEMPDPINATYKETRQLWNSMLLVSAVLFEGIGQVWAAASEFKWYKAYRAEFRPFIKNPETHALRDRFLEHFRNKTVSHVDAKAIRETLRWAKYKEYVFVGGNGASVYYPLADNIGFTGAMGEHADDDAEMETILEYLSQLRRVSVSFNRVVNTILAEYAERKEFTRRDRSSR